MSTCNECKYIARTYTGSVLSEEIIDVGYVCILNNIVLSNLKIKTHTCKHFLVHDHLITTNYLIKDKAGYREVK